MSLQKGRTAKKDAKSKSNGKKSGSDNSRLGIVSFASAKTGIARSDLMAIGIDEIYRNAAGGGGVSPSTQANVMLNAIGKMLTLEALKLRAGQLAKANGASVRFFLGDGQES